MTAAGPNEPRANEPRIVETTLQFPYSRTLGPVMGAFFSALRERRLLGITARDGRVIFPPAEYDPATGDALGIEHLVEVGPDAEVQSWTWVTEPTAKHPLTRPFAFALVKPEGADTSMVSAVDAGDAANMSSGMRVTPRFKSEPKGLVTDLEAWEPART